MKKKTTTKTEKNKIFYYLSVDDIQEVADQKLERELSPEEVKYVEDHVGDYIQWFDAISFAIDEMLYRRKDK